MNPLGFWWRWKTSFLLTNISLKIFMNSSYVRVKIEFIVKLSCRIVTGQNQSQKLMQFLVLVLNESFQFKALSKKLKMSSWIIFGKVVPLNWSDVDNLTLLQDIMKPVNVNRNFTFRFLHSIKKIVGLKKTKKNQHVSKKKAYVKKKFCPVIQREINT